MAKINSYVVLLYLGILCHQDVLILSERVIELGDCMWEAEESKTKLDLSVLPKFFPSVIDPINQAEFRYYPCKMDQQFYQYPCTEGSDAAICQRNLDGSVYIIGKLSSTTVTAETKGGQTTFAVKYGGGDQGRSGEVSILCHESGTFKFGTEDFSNLIYYFVLETNSACSGGATSGAASGGEAADGAALFITLIVVVIVAVSVYLVAGVLLMAFWKKERGLKLIPNFEFWKDFPFLLKDGFLFTFSCFQPLREKIGPDKGTYESLK